jgi:hypothetical protein
MIALYVVQLEVGARIDIEGHSRAARISPAIEFNQT